MALSNDSYSWYKVYSSKEEAAQQVPVRKLQKLELQGKQVCFAHTKAGFFAVNDACPHLGYSLSRGTINYLNEVICPWHSYRFDLQSGRECEYRSRNAATYPVEVRDDGVYVGLPIES